MLWLVGRIGIAALQRPANRNPVLLMTMARALSAQPVRPWTPKPKPFPSAKMLMRRGKVHFSCIYPLISQRSSNLVGENTGIHCRSFSSSSSSYSDADGSSSLQEIESDKYQILQYPHSKLRELNNDVSVFDLALRERAAVLVGLMYKFDGVGLAAPQVGMNEKVLVFPREIFEDDGADMYDDEEDEMSEKADSGKKDDLSIDSSHDSNHDSSGDSSNSSTTRDGIREHDTVVMCNPRIVTSSWEKNVCEEGCLSFPGIHADIVRPESVTVSYQDLKGDVHEAKLMGLGARVFQHEFDHLNQVLFIDHFSKEERSKHKNTLASLVVNFGAGGVL